VIARTCGLHAFRDVLEEARRFLSMPQPKPHASMPRMPRAPSGSPEAARRLFASAKPILGTISETYLRNRGISGVDHLDCLRFHPRCYYRAHDSAPRETWPALVAAAADLDGALTGILRTWLARDGSGKASLTTPRRALGRLLGSGVRFGGATDVMAAGEGLETMLSLRVVLPAMPMVAALSSAHLAALILPAGLRRIYIARDNDRAGHRAADALGIRANADGVEDLVLTPHADDFNTDLCGLGPEALAASLRLQLMPEDVERFLIADRRPGPRPRQRAPVPDPSSRSAAPGLQDGDGAGSG
jgi:Toprim domain-containing protein